MKKLLSAVLALVLVFACMTAFADRLDDIKARGYIEVATEPYFAPYEFIDASKTGDDQFVGMDMELAKCIAERIGVELRIVPLEFGAVLAGVANGKYDLAISAIAYSPVREDAMRLSVGYRYSDTGYGFIVRSEDADKYQTLDDIKKATVVTQSGSVQEAIYWQYVGSCKEFKLVSAMTDAYLAVANNKADVCICSTGSAQLYADANGGLAVTEYRFDVDPEMNSIRVGAPQDGTESLIEICNEVITELLAEDQLLTWYAEYEEYAKTLGVE